MGGMHSPGLRRDGCRAGVNGDKKLRRQSSGTSSNMHPTVHVVSRGISVRIVDRCEYRKIARVRNAGAARCGAVRHWGLHEAE